MKNKIQYNPFHFFNELLKNNEQKTTTQNTTIDNASW